VLALAVVTGLLLGIELVTAAAGGPRSYWHLVPVPESAAGRVAVLCGLMLLFIVAMALTARPRSGGLSLNVPDGVVLLPESVVARLVEQQFAVHADVVRARAEVTTGDDGVVVDVLALVRPGADVASLEPLVREAGVAGVRDALGVAPQVRRLRIKVLGVGDLARHL
jgi:hypothetical protein